MTLERVQILFTPSLELDAVDALLALCRNRKICLAWPGGVDGNRLRYAEPGRPEFYDADYSRFVDTYVITE